MVHNSLTAGELKILQHICPFNEKLPWEAVWDCKVLFYDDEELVEEDDEEIETDNQVDRSYIEKPNKSAKSATEAIPPSKESNRVKQFDKENVPNSNGVKEEQASSLKDPSPRKGIGCKCTVM